MLFRYWLPASMRKFSKQGITEALRRQWREDTVAPQATELEVEWDDGSTTPL